MINSTLCCSEANIFPDYILPEVNSLSVTEPVVVRVALAESIATLAETAVRFLEFSQLPINGSDVSQVSEVKRSKGHEFRDYERPKMIGRLSLFTFYV